MKRNKYRRDDEGAYRKINVGCKGKRKEERNIEDSLVVRIERIESMCTANVYGG